MQAKKRIPSEKGIWFVFCVSIKLSPVFTEHWCRLKGNILLLCRNSDRKCSEIEGLIFLEQFSVSPTNEADAPYAFKLG